MRITINPGTISGMVTAPPSKSMTQRAYAAALLHNGQTTIHYAGRSQDEQAALNAAIALGAKVLNENEHNISLSSAGINPHTTTVDCGESGLAARLFTPIAALWHSEIMMTGAGSLLRRPMELFRETLEPLGATLPDFDGHLPLNIKGPLHPCDITIDASGGSQLLSGILFALSYAATSPITITVNNLKSKPYIDLTLEVLTRFGRPARHTDHREFYIDPALFTHADTVDISIEGDWSGAANLLVAGAITGSATVGNLDMKSPQADRAIIDVLKTAGAQITITGNTITVNSAPLRGFEFDATDSPDLFPILAILAMKCEGDSYIKGVHRLFHKESNRAESISEMLEGFGVHFSIEDDVLCIPGAKRIRPTLIHSYNDHRIVMAAAVGGLCASGPVEIAGAEAVNKSYPLFFNDLSLLGATYMAIM